MTSVAAGEGTVTWSDSRAAGDAPGRAAPGGGPVRLGAPAAAAASPRNAPGGRTRTPRCWREPGMLPRLHVVAGPLVWTHYRVVRSPQGHLRSEERRVGKECR